jgi:hypothetical protein
MREFFASIYENIVYEGAFNLIYKQMFLDQGYIYIGLLFLLIPLVVLAAFYFERWFPYMKWWHWGIAVLVSSILVFGSTVAVFNIKILATSNPDLANALANPNSGYLEHAKSLRYLYGVINVGLALICSLIYSAALKRFSKLHSHLPI